MEKQGIDSLPVQAESGTPPGAPGLIGAFQTKRKAPIGRSAFSGRHPFSLAERLAIVNRTRSKIEDWRPSLAKIHAPPGLPG
jgi:hypothetical protein